MADNAKCFSPCVLCILASSSTTIRQLYSITKMPIYALYEYKEEGSGTGLNQKQGLVETDSYVIINFDMFRLSPELTCQNIGCFNFCTRMTRVFDIIMCTTPVIKCPV